MDCSLHCDVLHLGDCNMLTMAPAEMKNCCLIYVLTVNIVSYTRPRRIILVLIIKQDGYIIAQLIL